MPNERQSEVPPGRTPETVAVPSYHATPTLARQDVTALEKDTIMRLRNRAGWWEGDENALQVLRRFARESQLLSRTKKK